MKDPTKLEVTNYRQNQSKCTRDISSVNKPFDIAEVLHCYNFRYKVLPHVA